MVTRIKKKKGSLRLGVKRRRGADCPFKWRRRSWTSGWWRWWGELARGAGAGGSAFRLPGAEVGGASARLLSDKQESCESLDMLSLGLSYRKKQLAPLQVCKQSVSLRIFSHPITSPLKAPNLKSWPTSPTSCLSALFCFSLVFVPRLRLLLSLARQFRFRSHYSSFFVTFFVRSSLALLYFNYSGQLLSSSLFFFSLQSPSSQPT